MFLQKCDFAYSTAVFPCRPQRVHEREVVQSLVPLFPHETVPEAFLVIFSHFFMVLLWYVSGEYCLTSCCWRHSSQARKQLFLFMCMCASTILHHPRPSASALHGHSAVGTARCVADAMNARSLLMCCCARSVTSWISSYYGPWPTVKVIYQFQFNIYVLTGSSWFIVANEISWLI